MKMKNVHPVYGAGILTHNLRNMRPLSLPLDQGGPAQFSQSYPSESYPELGYSRLRVKQDEKNRLGWT